MASKNLTPFGQFVRKLRVDRNMLLKEMAKGVGLSSAWLSAVETGRKPIPKDLVARASKFLGLDQSEHDAITEAAERSKETYRLVKVHPERRDVAAALARRFNSLSEDDLDEIREIVNRRRA